jgi:hypothetical protein
LLVGGGKKTAAEKKEIKHDPEAEFIASSYRMATGPTLLGFPASGIKQAMATAALVTEGVKKTEVNRLIFVPTERISIWGKPYLRMDVVRSADMNKTPDIRTRVYCPRWCAEVDLAFITPMLSAAALASLLANAGVICGIGDFRQEKGKGNFGCFSVVSDPVQEALFEELREHEGRDAQETAFTNMEPFDEETRELWAMLKSERLRRSA